MPKKRLGAEQIVTKLRQIEVLQARAKAWQWRARRWARPSKMQLGSHPLRNLKHPPPFAFREPPISR
jgi:hypothetical protein